jgi:hypothetical protein
MKHINTICEKIAELVNITKGGTHSYHGVKGFNSLQYKLEQRGGGVNHGDLLKN